MTRAELEPLRLQAAHVAGLMRLPFRRRAWRGVQGNWQGTGTGSSLDFQDHRPYAPGDDPRYINWQAYARTGHFTMKLYREEVSPALDLAVDLSASMFVDEEKAARCAELVYWAVENAMQAGASIRCFAVRGSAVEPLSLESIEGDEWAQASANPQPAALESIPWRHGSLRVVISDLLWPGEIQPVFQALDEQGGSGTIFAPYSPAEAEPDWAGNLQMLDCESEEVRVQRLDAGALSRYRAAYLRHFDLWQQQALRYHVPLARIRSDVDLAEALRSQVGETGAVEWAHGV